MKQALLSILLAAAAVPAHAQVAPEADADADAPPAARRALGVGVAVSDSPYAGEGNRVTPFPLLVYEGERFFFRGITAGWRLVEGERFGLAAIAQLRLDGFEVADLGRVELARNGLDPLLLEDRDDGLDAGLSARWSGNAGELELELLADASGASGGQEASLRYGHPWQLGSTQVTPHAGVRWMSAGMADYYYGTLDEEVARGAPRYRPGAVVIPHAGVTVARGLGRQWSAFATLDYQRLPGAIQDSPWLEPDRTGSVSLLLGLSRGF